MEFINSTLPWTGAAVRRSENLIVYLAQHLPEGWSKYLPSSIFLFVDHQVAEAAVADFLSGMAIELQAELETRIARQRQFVQLGLLSEGEMRAFLTERRGVQPWAIYYSANGGLGTNGNWFHDLDAPKGVVPCSSMSNHGVAWERAADGSIHTWLATSPREGLKWDWQSDIGHESAHAAFAQVPFFVQVNPNIAPDSLSTVVNPDDLTTAQVAQIIYLYSEIAVVAVRGESRSTPTGLPVTSPSELEALLRISAKLTGTCDFDGPLQACSRARGRIDVNCGDGIFEIAAPIMRLIPSLTQFINDAIPPSMSTFETIVRDATKATAGYERL